MMNNLIQFECQQCGLCCQTKYLCLYPLELNLAKKYAQKLNKELKVEPLRKILDIQHQKIIVLIYRVIDRPCPFFSMNQCQIHQNKFIACRKYPISSWIDLGNAFKILGFNNEFYDVDNKCSFIQTHTAFKKLLTEFPLSSILFNEYQAVLEDKRIWMELDRKFTLLKKQGKITSINENKLKKNNLRQYEEIIKSWEQLSAIDFLNYFG